MSSRVTVYQIMNHRRSRLVCEAMMKGIRSAGDMPTLKWEHDWKESDEGVAVFYGLVGNLPKILAQYPKQGRHAVYVDLGYWGRHDGGRWAGFHKVVVNDRHPTAYFQNRPMDPRRAERLGVKPLPWRGGGSKILLAGMGDKGAEAEGFKPEEWERAVIAEIRQHTDREIVYRPKPSWKTAQPIEGVGYSPPTDKDIQGVLKDCHAVVTHHSNVAVDGLVMGVPAFCWRGVAVPMGLQDMARIEKPHQPDGRLEWISCIAHTQFNFLELAQGKPWRHLKDEGLLP